MDLPRVTLASTGAGQAPVVLELDPADLGERDLMAAMLQGEVGAVIVRQGLPEAPAVADWLQAHPGPAGPHHTPPFPGVTYGSVLVIAGAGRPAYHAHAEALLALLAGMASDPVPAMGALLARVAGGAPVRPPVGATGPYAPVTVRVLDPGQHVSVHSERDGWPSMDEVRAQARSEVQLSCYAPLRLGQDGGELVLYHRPPEGQAPHLEGLRDTAAHEVLAAFGVTELRPRVGDLLVFGGGRYNHQVRPATRGQRWTMGSFLAPAREGGGYLWWS